MGLSKLGQGQCRLDISDSIEFIAGFIKKYTVSRRQSKADGGPRICRKRG